MFELVIKGIAIWYIIGFVVWILLVRAEIKDHHEDSADYDLSVNDVIIRTPLAMTFWPIIAIWSTISWYRRKIRDKILLTVRPKAKKKKEK